MKNKYLLALLGVIACILAIVPCIYFMKQNERYTLQEAGYQNIHGVEKTFQNKDVLESMNGQVEVVSTKEKLVTYPIYFKQRKALLCLKPMAVVFPEKETMNKINVFSFLYQKDNEFYVEEGNKKHMLKDCFLFDGEDTYIFLEEVEVHTENQIITLSPLSYIQVNEANNLLYYDYEKNMFEQIDITGAIKVILNEKESIQLQNDTLIKESGQWLLYGTVDKLENIQ